MLLKKHFLKSLVIITTFFSLNAFTQECPPLPKHGFQVDYHQESIDLYDSHLLKGNQFMSHEIKLDIQKEKELKSYFNRVLWDMKQAECIPNKVLENKTFLFQTQQSLKDSLGYQTSIHNKHEHIHFDNNTQTISVVYGKVYQLNVSILADSIRISNWYIKRFWSNELVEITQERKKLAFLADSLNQEIAKLEDTHQDWRITNPQINTLRKRRAPLKAQIDSIDFILYPSLLQELKPWYEQQFETTMPSLYNPEGYISSAGFGQKGVVIYSNTDPFLEKKFRLHHVVDNNPYFAKTISMGDSTILQGQAIYNTKYLRENDSPWREGHFSYWSLNEKFLIVLKRESNIGETFWDYKNAYYIYEVIE
jgi:hypothetical protein